MTGAGDPARFREAVVAHFPELAGARFRLLPPGWHSLAVDVDDRLIFKFPKDAVAEAALRREAGLLRALRGAVTLPIPELTLHGPPLFSRHRKIPGEPLLGTDYERLSEGGRRRLADALARFHAELHALDRARMAAAGATPIGPWSAPDDILRRMLPVLPRRLHGFAEATLDEWRAMPADPGGTVYGFFDGHGWNMAFDHARGRLNGIFDFADSGFGDLHQDFVYASFVSADLTRRVVDAYERLTARSLDRRRIAVLTGVLRLWELAEEADNPAACGTMLAAVEAWAGL